MTPGVIYFIGLGLLILFGRYFATDVGPRKRLLAATLVLLLTVFSIWSNWPAEKKIRLGLDIKGGTSFLIAIVYLEGQVVRGSRRWIDFGFFRFQPSEFGKVLFVLALAGFLAERYKRLSEPRTTLTAIGLALVPIFLVFLQPDFGSALVYCAAIAAMLFVAGTPWSQLVALAAAIVAVAVLVLGALPAAGLPILKQYQQERLTSFLNPDKDPGGTTYNITQSKNAIGNGGVTGRGFGNGSQTAGGGPSPCPPACARATASR